MYASARLPAPGERYSQGEETRFRRAVEASLAELQKRGASGVSELVHLSATGKVALIAAIAPPALDNDTNDYAPVGFDRATVLLLSATDGNWDLTGLAGGPPGRYLLLFNTSAANGISLVAEASGSAAANRFVGAVDLAAGTGVAIWYDGAASRWRPVQATP